MTTDFFPKDYELPKTPSGYMKLEDGQNKFRILSAPLIGWMYWTKNNKPVRSPEPFTSTPEDARLDDDAFKPKHFWNLIVWNYAEKRLQILEITQASIQGPINDLVCNADWGDPREYDITITKKGQKLDTEYTVQPSPQKAVPGEALAAFQAQRINLEALYVGGDPFAAGERDEITDKDGPFPR
jgi:hypothetical protein